MEDYKSHFPIHSSPPPPPLSFKQKLKQSLFFSCCFRRRRPLDSPPHTDDKPSLTWLKQNLSRHDVSGDFKDKCKGILGRIANPMNKHRRHSSTEFRYDPLSYSLNFEDGFGDSKFDDEAQLKNFAARFPPSPASAAEGVVEEVSMREITAIG